MNAILLLADYFALMHPLKGMLTPDENLLKEKFQISFYVYFRAQKTKVRDKISIYCVTLFIIFQWQIPRSHELYNFYKLKHIHASIACSCSCRSDNYKNIYSINFISTLH